MNDQAGHCRSCGAPVRWLTNDKTGKVAPIDVASADDGAVILAGAGRYHVLTKAEREAGVSRPRHSNHWQTCPDRAAWKERTGR